MSLRTLLSPWSAAPVDTEYLSRLSQDERLGIVVSSLSRIEDALAHIAAGGRHPRQRRHRRRSRKQAARDAAAVADTGALSNDLPPASPGGQAGGVVGTEKMICSPQRDTNCPSSAEKDGSATSQPVIDPVIPTAS